MNAIAPLGTILTDSSDPARLGYPPTLPLEVALKTGTIPEICEEYGLDRDTWNNLRLDPGFRADVQRYVEMLREEGMSFKLKARLQSEELLKTSWRMIHSNDPTIPPNVRADLIKSTMRWAGYDSKTSDGGGSVNNLQIVIDLA